MCSCDNFLSLYNFFDEEEAKKPEPKIKKRNRFVNFLNQFYDLIGFLLICFLVLSLYIFLEKKFILHNSYNLDYRFLAEMFGYVLLIFMVIGLVFMFFRDVIFILIVLSGIYLFCIKDYSLSNEFSKYSQQYLTYINSFKLKEYNKAKLNQFYLDKSSKEIVDIINKYKNHRKIRNFTLEIIKTKRSNNKYYSNTTLVRDCFEVYRYVNNKWLYASDPRQEEYFASPLETLKHLCGDCDDYALFLTSLVSSMGAEVRLVITENHIYPELYIGTPSHFYTEIEPMLNEMFYSPFRSYKNYSYHIDKEEKLWLNMDFGNIPGGSFLDERVYKVVYL